ncbi:MAG: hypothetical protein ABF289_16065 [Clostridiales bacterium]
MKKYKGFTIFLILLFQIMSLNSFAEDNSYISPKLVDDVSLYPQHMYNSSEAIPSETKMIYDIKNNRMKFRTDSGFGFWKILSHDTGPMNFTINMNNFSSYGAKMSIGAYDVENDGRLPNLANQHEIDKLYIANSSSEILLGNLKGSHRTLSQTIFDIPENTLLPEENNFRLDVDTELVDGKYLGWLCGLTYASIEVPFNIGFMTSNVVPEIENSYAVEPTDVLERDFDPNTGDILTPNIDNKIKTGLKFNCENSKRNIIYNYNLESWKQKPYWTPNVVYTWKIIEANNETNEIVSEESGENNAWSGNFTMMLPEIEGPYKLVINMDIYNGENFIKSQEIIHDLDVIFSSKNISDSQFDEYINSDDQINY